MLRPRLRANRVQDVLQNRHQPRGQRREGASRHVHKGPFERPSHRGTYHQAYGPKGRAGGRGTRRRRAEPGVAWSNRRPRCPKPAVFWKSRGPESNTKGLGTLSSVRVFVGSLGARSPLRSRSSRVWQGGNKPEGRESVHEAAFAGFPARDDSSVANTSLETRSRPEGSKATLQPLVINHGDSLL